MIIAFMFHTCWNKGDDSHIAEVRKVVPINKDLQLAVYSFISSNPAIGTLGIVIYDATANQEVYSLHGDSLMQPASCLKLVTCVTALKTFGKSYEYKTRLYTSGKVVNDTLVGNLTLKVQFDPAFNRDSLYILADALKDLGVKHIKGKVVLDMSDYSLMNHEEHWIAGDLKTRYLGLAYYGGSRLRNEMLYALVAKGVHMRKEDIVFGRLDYAKSTLVSEIKTPINVPLEKSLKFSSNINAESLLYPLGYVISRQGHFRKNGVIALKKFVAEQLHMNPDKHCIIDDGCGLCPENRVSPHLLVNTLLYAYQHKYIYQTVLNALPLSGTDGTLYDRLRKPEVMGKIRAKTGTLTRDGGISTLSGYYRAKDGHLMIFSIMNNNCPVMEGRRWQDRFLTKIIDK